jgi:hypothetical protein
MASLNPIVGPLGNQNAAHLLRRATFGPLIQDIQQFSSLTAATAFQQLIQAQTAPDFPVDPLTGTNWVFPNTASPSHRSKFDRKDGLVLLHTLPINHFSGGE